MKRLLNILLFFVLPIAALGQRETQTVDSLLNVFPAQEGRDKVLTMIELTWEFHYISYDDCLDWGEKAIKEAQKLGLEDLEADAFYALGMQYGYHGDLDLAQENLRKAFRLHEMLGNETRAFEDIWNQARFEQYNGNIDTALCIYQKVLSYAENRLDSLAMAQTYSNIAILQYQKLDFTSSDSNFKNSLELYKSINDTVMTIRTLANIATLHTESGNYSEARKLFRNVISRMEEMEDYRWLMKVYKNYGQLFVKDLVDFDSAKYYFEQAYSTGGLLIENGINVPVPDLVDIIIEIGNTAYNQGNYKEAIQNYKEAFELADSISYVTGKMFACMGFGSAYSYLAMPKESLYYLNLFFELEAKSGITIAHSSMKFPLMLNYARLGMLDDLESELSDIEDEFDGLLREKADLYEQNDLLQGEVADLVQLREFQNQQILNLQTQCNQYHLAFYGLLAIVLFVVFLLLAYKFVRKNQTKNEKG